MSGDVQPRKRKDKKRKKDELGVEEPRGTSAVFGEGDVFMHSPHEHGTGGHWCAKVIFFSLLAILITLIGLIILENRGLTDLEANSVESQYSGVLEGWLEEAPDDDHHDEHTLELKHHDDEGDENDHGDELDHDEDDEEDHDEEDHNDDDHSDEYENDNEDEDDSYNDEDDDNNDEGDNDERNQDYEFEDDEHNQDEDDDHNQDDDDDDDENNQDDEDDEHQIEDDSQERNEKAHNEDEEDHNDEPDDVEIEMEKIEKEVSEEDDASSEVPSYAHFDEVDGESQEDEKDADADVDGDVEEEDFLEPEDEELPVVEHITVPAGKPLTEVEDETSSERPPDTLAEEEEYEKQQEELRREQEQASHLWLKLAVGGALLAATHALVRRATAAAARASPDTATSDEHASREETPSLIDRRMTLIMEETPVPVVPKIVPRETPKPIEREVFKKSPIVVKAPHKQDTKEQEVEIPIIAKAKKNVEVLKDKELYSDDEDEDEEEVAETKKEVTKKSEPVKEKEPTPEPEDDDVEIIDDEQLDEELEEEDVEEEISDVDDAELLSRLEAKYGRLPEPERPERKHKDGGNSIEDEWPGEPSDPYWREQLDRAEEDLRQGEWSSSLERARASSEAVECSGSARARWLVARALDAGAAARRDNALLVRAIAAYKHLLDMNERLTDVQLRTVTERAIDRIMFRGNYLGAEPIYRLLIRRFPDEPGYRNNLTVSFLMANRADLAEEVLKDTLKRWPNDRIALAHHGFVLKTQHKRLEEAVTAFQKALEGDTGPANEPRFYYHLGDALLLLGRFAEANEVHKRGSALGHFLSPAQRSLYNVNHLTGRPWWNIEDTPYIKLIRALEKSWKEILKEGEAARAVYEKEKEGLKERGEWSQLDLFVRGREIPGRCDRAPVTCSIVRAEAAASGCRRGQIKFSSMEAGTHVRPHVGPTNCRLRMHLGLSNTKNTFIRVDKETRQWETGKVFIFDDSFEHEVWHNGTGTRLVLIVDVWHPDLTPTERRQLPAI